MDQAQEIELVRSLVAKHFVVYDVKVSQDAVQVFVTPDMSRLDTEFDALRKEMSVKGYIPILDHRAGEYIVAVIRRPPLGPGRNWINMTLLIITLGTTIFAGAFLWAAYNNSTDILTVDNVAFGTLFFALPLMTILGVHELAHYIASKRYGIDASLPYFIPSIPPLGTFGAFISIREPLPNKKSLVDIGMAGPIAGILVSIPIAILGLWLNAQGPVNINAAPGGSVLINFPFFYDLIALIVPQPEGLVAFHPLAFAAWVGFFVTAINLLPAGQLDGGHVARGLLGDNAKYLSVAIVGILIFLGIWYGYFGWLFFAFLIIFIGMRHPAPLNDVSKLDKKRIGVGVLGLVLLVGTFVPVPLEEIPITYDFQIAVHGTNQTTVAAGAQAYFNMTINNTGTVSNQVRASVINTPAGFSTLLYPSNANSSAATNTLVVQIPWDKSADITLQVNIDNSTVPGVKVFQLESISNSTTVVQQFTVTVI
ncbi:MAG TPA: site-2 protease family protein [Methanomassiliicoccales archaeon]|nr:site-2 protease family protein [Methanomassiliicoccales archaeon]